MLQEVEYRRQSQPREHWRWRQSRVAWRYFSNLVRDILCSSIRKLWSLPTTWPSKTGRTERDEVPFGCFEINLYSRQKWERSLERELFGTLWKGALWKTHHFSVGNVSLHLHFIDNSQKSMRQATHLGFVASRRSLYLRRDLCSGEITTQQLSKIGTYFIDSNKIQRVLQ